MTDQLADMLVSEENTVLGGQRGRRPVASSPNDRANGDKKELNEKYAKWTKYGWWDEVCSLSGDWIRCNGCMKEEEGSMRREDEPGMYEGG